MTDKFANLRGTTRDFFQVGPDSAVAGGPPTTGPHLVGEFYNDIRGQTYSCVESGTPGVWYQVLQFLGVRKENDTTRTNDDTPTADPDLVLPVLASNQYLIEAAIFVDGENEIQFSKR